MRRELGRDMGISDLVTQTLPFQSGVRGGPRTSMWTSPENLLEVLTFPGLLDQNPQLDKLPWGFYGPSRLGCSGADHDGWMDGWID